MQTDEFDATDATDTVAFQERFRTRGYAIARALLDPAETRELTDEFMRLQASGPVPGHFEPKPQPADGPHDPLRAYPRVMQPHRFNDLALRRLLDPRLAHILAGLFGEEPLAAQSMFYFKPPGARGQALHQDNFYLRVEPGTCIAAWVALDHIDRDNGGLEVVPGTHLMDLFCPEEADASVSFAREYVPPPPGLVAEPVDMAPGDVLFFNGTLVHGSGPNRTKDRFRRSFICHYVGRSAERIAGYYELRDMDGRVVEAEESTGGGPCGNEFTPAMH
ncbi:phytanoyl-CoA dioxygenase family protein [Streptomyces sp. NPDC006422]|uniref:phytanoyl-CoA dioxygenase family protein n=1 Tax=unclassified Streptomyces TaxID=2593676 RepID=UPI0033BD5268